MHGFTYAVSYVISHYGKAVAFNVLLDGMGYVGKPVSLFAKLEPFIKASPGNVDQPLCRLINLSYRISSGRITVISFVYCSCIHAHNIAFAKLALPGRDSVHYLVVYGNTGARRVSVITFKSRNHGVFQNALLYEIIQFLSGYSRLNDPGKVMKNLSDYGPCLLHYFNLVF